MAYVDSSVLLKDTTAMVLADLELPPRRLRGDIVSITSQRQHIKGYNCNITYVYLVTLGVVEQVTTWLSPPVTSTGAGLGLRIFDRVTRGVLAPSMELELLPSPAHIENIRICLFVVGV